MFLKCFIYIYYYKTLTKTELCSEHIFIFDTPNEYILIITCDSDDVQMLGNNVSSVCERHIWYILNVCPSNAILMGLNDFNFW